MLSKTSSIQTIEKTMLIKEGNGLKIYLINTNKC